MAWMLLTFVLRMKQGASLNFFLPLVPVGIAVIAGAFEQLGARIEPLLLIQFLILSYNPGNAMPTVNDRRAGLELLGALGRIPGDIFLPQFPAYLTMLGKARVAEGAAVCDLAALRPDLLQRIREQVEAGQYTAAVPWAADGRAGKAKEACRPERFNRPSTLFASIPAGGSFFAASHLSKISGIFLFEAPGGLKQSTAAR